MPLIVVSSTCSTNIRMIWFVHENRLPNQPTSFTYLTYRPLLMSLDTMDTDELQCSLMGSSLMLCGRMDTTQCYNRRCGWRMCGKAPHCDTSLLFLYFLAVRLDRGARWKWMVGYCIGPHVRFLIYRLYYFLRLAFASLPFSNSTPRTSLIAMPDQPTVSSKIWLQGLDLMGCLGGRRGGFLLSWSPLNGYWSFCLLLLCFNFAVQGDLLPWVQVEGKSKACTVWKW